MRPTRLRLSAFCAYAGDQAFDFTEGLRGHGLFLIHGPTGAGKTSILDGLCYALFGQSSGQERGPGHLRSQHAEAGCRTEAELEFSLGADRYRILRRAAWQRPARRGGGTVAEEGSVALWRITDQPELVAEGERNVAPAIELLLGYRAAEFRQVVLLPQGRFRELLTASPRDRQEILSRLFRTLLYRRIAAELQAGAKAASEALKQAEIQRNTLLRQAGAETAEAAVAARDLLSEQANEARQARDRATLAVTASRRALEAGRRDAGLLEAAGSARLALDLLLAEAPAARRRSEDLAQARRADRLRGDHATWLAADAAAGKAASECLGREEEVRQAQARHDRAVAALADAAARTEARAVAADAAFRLGTLADQAEQAALAEAEHDAALKALEVAGTTQEHAEREAQAAGLALGQAQAVHATQQALAAQLPHRRLAVDAARRLARDLGEAGRLATACAGLRQDLEKAEAAGSRAATALHQAEAGQSAGEQAAAADRAAHLAALLTAGTPCPVCGSQHHPAPARPGDAALPDLAALAEATGAARKALDELREDYTTLREKLRGEQAKLQALQADLGDAPPPDLPGLLAAQAEADAAAKALPGLLRARDSAEARSRAAATALQLAQGAAQAAALGEARLRQARDGLAVGLPAGASAAGLRDAADREAARAAALDKALSDDRAEATRWQATLGERQARAAAAATAAAQAAAEAGRAAADLAAACTAAGFADRAALAAALLSAEALEALATQVEAEATAIASAGARAEAAALAAAGLAMPDLAALESEAEDGTAIEQAASGQAGALAEALAARDRLLEDIAAAETTRATAEAAWRLREDLADLASGGRNQQRMNLEGFVLCSLLDEALSAANRRLRRMLAGRYTLRRVEVPERANAGVGLDIEILDEQTGQRRPAGTLSGGEGFCAALALALGLSDTVQAHAGARRIDALFVDEGFGTLDEEALETAIGVLAELQAGNRLVGIISHVPELRSRIPARLEVVPGPRGSSASFRFG